MNDIFLTEPVFLQNGLYFISIESQPLYKNFKWFLSETQASNLICVKCNKYLEKHKFNYLPGSFKLVKIFPCVKDSTTEIFTVQLSILPNEEYLKIPIDYSKPVIPSRKNAK